MSAAPSPFLTKKPRHTRAVRGSEHREVQAVGVIIFELLARALLHIRRRNDAEIGFCGEANLARFARWRTDDQRGNIIGAGAHGVVEDDLRGPASPYSGDNLADEAIAPFITTHGGKRRADIFQHAVHTQLRRQSLPQAQAFRVGIVFRHEQANNICCPERVNGKCGADAGIDTAGNAEHQPTLAQVETKRLADFSAIRSTSAAASSSSGEKGRLCALFVIDCSPYLEQRGDD